MYTVKLPDYVELIFNCSQSTGAQISKANSTNVSYMIETNSQDMVTSLSDAANLCGGAANSDVKAVRFGSYANKSYNQGALTITLKESYKIKSIDVTLSTYKSTNSSAPANPTWNLDINGYQMAETISTDVENPTVYNISFGNTDAKEASVNTLTIKSTNAPVDVYSLRINIDPVPTEIVEIVTEQSGEAVYYNLQGVRVDNPANGIFIRVANGKSSKVIL